MRKCSLQWTIGLLLSIAGHIEVVAQSPETLRKKAMLPETNPGERQALLQAAWQMDTTNHEYRYELALSCISLGFQREAIEHLQFIYKKDEGKLYPDNLYYQATLYSRLGQISKAQELFEKYLKRHVTNGCPECVKASRTEIENIKRIKKRQPADSRIPHPFEAELDSMGLPNILNLGGEIHTQHVLIGPYTTGLYYRECNDDCMVKTLPYARMDQVITAADKDIITFSREHTAFSARNSIICAVSADGIFVFTDTTGAEINFIPKFLHNLPEFKETTPALNAALDELYFSSNRTGGFGGMDIWVSRRQGNSWLPPENCGKKCNSQGDEVFPTVYANNLYFSSDGHDVLGGMDIFMWEIKTEKRIHLEEPVSSFADDIGIHFISLPNGQQIAAWSSNRPTHNGADACCFHIWHAEMMQQHTSETPQIINSKTDFSDHLVRRPIKLYFHNDEPDPRSRICETQKNYESCLNSYRALKPEYLLANESVSNPSFIEGFFDLQLTVSEARMDSLFKEIHQTLQEGFNAALFIRGFASTRASSAYNQCLSERRISSFKNSLEKWRDGVILPFMNMSRPNQLALITRPLGEDTTREATGEEIYSYRACQSRRIEIEQLLSGNGEVLAPTFIEWKANEDKASFIVVNISAHPIQPVMADLQEGLSAAGLREIPALNEITVTLSRTKGEITTHIEGYRINVVSKGKSQVEIKLDPLEK